jgi:hypothetical protein
MMHDEGGRPAWALRVIQARLALGWSQHRLAVELAGLIGRRTGQPADPENLRRGLTEWEMGRRKPLAQSWDLLACALEVSVPWLRDGAVEEDEDVDRRELLTALGVVGFAGLGADAPRRVGMADVGQVRAMTALYESCLSRHGGGGLQVGLAAFADRSARLLDGRYTDLVEPRLHQAVADVRQLAGWAHFDAGAHRRANAQWRLATVSAQRAGDATLLAKLGYNRSRQHRHLGRPADAVATIREARAAAAGKVTPTVESMLGMEEAVSLAMLGDPHGALAAVRRAEDAFANRNPADDPQWAWFFDSAELAVQTGEVHRWLAQRDPRHAEAALNHSMRAITSYGRADVVKRALTQVSLASEHALVGDPARAVVEGREALAAAAELQSRRLLDRLASLPADLAKHRAVNVDVRDLVHDIRAARAQ